MSGFFAALSAGAPAGRERLGKEELPQMFSKPTCNRVIILTGAVLLTGGVACAQMRPGETAPQTPSTNTNGTTPGDSVQQQQNAQAGAMQDKDFVRSALQGGMAEVELGQLAAEKGSTDDVKQFGQKMVADHTKLGDQMKQVAQQIGVNPPTKLSKKDEELKAKLQNLSGTQFDNAYIVAMVKDHKKDAEEFKAEASQSQNPAVQQAAQQGAQVVDQHLQMIEQIAESHNLMNNKGKLTSSGQ
jgi:putative membrane protein